MAKLRAGCIAKKGKKYYLVYKNKWIALKTEDAREAEKRAVDFIPGLGLPEAEWLSFLVELGEKAKARLIKESAPKDIDWDNIYFKWTAENKRLTKNASTLRSYEGQIKALTDWAQTKGVAGPGEITRGMAAEYLGTRTPESQKRDCALFARIYNHIGLDAGIWEGQDLDVPTAQRYRRITREELVKLLSVAQNPVDNALLRLGLTTGMRLGSCLEITDLFISGDFLSTIPGKTRNKKNKPLTIPLLPGTKKALAAIAPDYFAGLRADTTSNRLKDLFKKAGVGNNHFGNASFHSLRATFISLMDEAGIPPHVTDAITGHASQGMHGRYSQPSKKALMDAVVKAIPDLP